MPRARGPGVAAHRPEQGRGEPPREGRVALGASTSLEVGARAFSRAFVHAIVEIRIKANEGGAWALQREGRLDPADFGIPRRHATADDIKRGRLFALAPATALIALLLLAQLAADKYCLFPPCY